MTKPISPQEVEDSAHGIPDEVVEAFNELVTSNYIAGESHVGQNEVIDRIRSKLPDVTRNAIFDRKWLNIEGLYAKEGWSVHYRKPAWDETFEAYFRFVKVHP